MKKIDLHIHTMPSFSDSNFKFSLNKLKEYVQTVKIACIAITNHNLFDLDQFNEIADGLSIVVYPGIEINLENGHLLLISDKKELQDFKIKCDEISKRITKHGDCINIEDLKSIFSDLSKYILIPHYDKKPSISEEKIGLLKDFIFTGEVNSPKKFVYCLKSSNSLVPAYFSDIRIDENLTTFPTRQTFVNCGDITFAGIRNCLQDKQKVSLSEKDGHKFFQVFDDGFELSTGLNVILGERSSGKTYTLQRIFENFENVKYIRQFSLLEKDDTADSKKFSTLLSQKHSLFTQDFFEEFRETVNDIVDIDIEKNETLIEQYIASLLKNASETEKVDAFSKAQLFNEIEFTDSNQENLKTLIASVTSIIENTEYRDIIEKFISLTSLKELAIELMEKYNGETELQLKKRWLNDLIISVKKTLQMHTATTAISEIDLYKIAIEKKKVEKFQEIAAFIQRDRQIMQKDVQGFKVVAATKKFQNATDLKNQSGVKLSFAEAFQAYREPYEFLLSLKRIEGLEAAEYFKLFAKIEYKILNKHGFEVSGGERSEFNLLQEISDAQQFDMLLIDEPESSFDNLFLKNDVNELIKEISKNVPVVLVTHNNTVGASIKPDFVVYTKKMVSDQGVEYCIYSGYPSDSQLTSKNGNKITNYEVILDCLEAGKNAYQERGQVYEILKN